MVDFACDSGFVLAGVQYKSVFSLQIKKSYSVFIPNFSVFQLT